MIFNCVGFLFNIKIIGCFSVTYNKSRYYISMIINLNIDYRFEFVVNKLLNTFSFINILYVYI